MHVHVGHGLTGFHFVACVLLGCLATQEIELIHQAVAQMNDVTQRNAVPVGQAVGACASLREQFGQFGQFGQLG